MRPQKNCIQTNEVIKAKTLYAIYGIQRSGINALFCWLQRPDVYSIRYLNSDHYVPEDHPTSFDKLLVSLENAELVPYVESVETYNVVLLRDPFNLFASQLKRFRNNRKNLDFDQVALWLMYAKEYLGETNHLNATPVNYTKWVILEGYRRELCDKLGFFFSDERKNQVPVHGGGSSFDGHEFDGKADKMNLFTRYREFVNDPEYQSLLTDEVIEYASKCGFI